MQQEKIAGSRRMPTAWLGKGVSITDGDFACLGSKGLQIAEFKKDKPLLNFCQLILFQRMRTHVVVHFGPNPWEWDRSSRFDLYCPQRQYSTKDTSEGTLIVQEPRRLTRNQAIPILRGDAPWPCCRRYSIVR